MQTRQLTKNAQISPLGSEEVLSPLQKLESACRILYAKGHFATLAGQITMRDKNHAGYWTPPMGPSFAKVRAEQMLLVDDELSVKKGNARPNPAVRFHTWVYRHRPDVNAIVHTHPPYVSALAMLGIPLPVAHMDSCMFHDDCGFLAQWPGVPVDDEEGRIITQALGSKRVALLANHGHICACASVEEAVYMAICVEHAAKLALLALPAGAIQPIRADLARSAHYFLLQPSIVNGTFAYWRDEAVTANQ